MSVSNMVRMRPALPVRVEPVFVEDSAEKFTQNLEGIYVYR